MNRFKILKTSGLEPCFAPVDSTATKDKLVKKSSGNSGYTGVIGIGSPQPLTTAALESMHGTVVARLLRSPVLGRFR